MKRLFLLLLITFLTIFVDAKTIKIITTGDMHGWLEPQPSMTMKVGGAAEMLANWKIVEKYDKNNCLILSAGDNFTGAAISGITEGDSVIDIMNLMQYDATAMGNHEFDYKADKVAEWKKKANFEFLSANLYSKNDLTTSWQKPYKIFNKDDVKIGVIGLTTTELNVLSNNATDYTVTKYQDTLRDIVPKIRNEGAEVVVVLAHVEQDKLIELAKSCADLKIALYIGGHTHEFAQRMTGSSWVVNSGDWWKGYSVVEISVNNNVSLVTASKQVYLWGDTVADKVAATEISKWKSETDKLLNLQIGYTVTGIPVDPALYNLVTDIWLSAVPDADIAICNYGGLRQSIPPANINYGTVLGIMPFVNKLVKIEISGEKLIQTLPANGKIGISGLKIVDKKYLLKNGTDIIPNKLYQVVMSDFQVDVTPLYKESSKKELFASWRDPIIQWLKENKTSVTKPLESIIDMKQR